MDRTTTAVLGSLIALLLSGNAAALATIDDGRAHPTGWDPRVAPLVAFVEEARHLRFERPVEVEFLTEAEYRKTQIADAGELTQQEREELENFEGQARALGLIGSDTELLDDLNKIVSGGTLAYYDDVEEKIVIRGTTVTLGVKVTIAHELTHALQDQVFGLDREFKTEGAEAFFKGLVEGDASRVENEYVASLTDGEQQRYFNESNRYADAAEGELAAVAPALLALFGAPYALGEQLTALLVEERGVKALDRLFRSPPNSDEGLLDPFAALDGERAKKLAEPKLRAGEDKTGSGDFGVVPWYLVLASFVDAKAALGAVDGWGGDSYVAYTKDGRSCIRIAFVGDTPDDTAEMGHVLFQWARAFTENTAQLDATAERVELDACEPAVAPKPRADAQDALVLPVTRMAFVGQVLASGAPRKLAECATKHFIAQAPLDAIANPTAAQQKRLFDLGLQVGRGCSSGRLT